jgi:LysR family glycine cleavage system transcriptional activator
MSINLPPLTSLRAFEAAARHESFAQAADELHVTPAAVSHQVKALESFLGIELFHRKARGLTVTEAGRSAQPLLREGFEQLGEAVLRMRSVQDELRLTVSVGTSFASMWLVPHLEGFRRRHPDIDVLVDATDETVDLRKRDADIGIRYGGGKYPGLHADHIVGEAEFPVCSPALLEGPHPLRTPDDLCHHTLLHDLWWEEEEADLWPSWTSWLCAAGVEGIDASKGPRFSQAALAIQAAVEGHGVALTSMVLAGGELAEGWLVRPFELHIGDPDSFGYYLVTATERINEPKIAAFRTWLLEETVSHRETLAS